MSIQEHNNAALAATLQPYYECLKHDLYLYQSDIAFLCLPCPLPPADCNPSQVYIYDAQRPGASGCVRVYPDVFLLYKLKTYTLRPGRPGENQHIAHARARVCVFLFFSDIYFYLLLKIPRHPGRAFDIGYLRPDIHPDAPGRPGRINKGGLSCH